MAIRCAFVHLNLFFSSVLESSHSPLCKFDKLGPIPMESTSLKLLLLLSLITLNKAIEDNDAFPGWKGGT